MVFEAAATSARTNSPRMQNFNFWAVLMMMGVICTFAYQRNLNVGSSNPAERQDEKRKDKALNKFIIVPMLHRCTTLIWVRFRKHLL